MKYKAKKTEALKIPKVNGKEAKSTRSSNRKKTFNDEESVEADIVDTLLTTSDGDIDGSNGNEEVDDAPEMIRSNDDSLLALRQSHQNISFLSNNSTKNKKTKRRTALTDQEKSINKIEMLDDSVLEALTASLNTQPQEKNTSTNNLSSYVTQRKKSESQSLNNIKKIGNFEVSVMDDARAADPLSSFPLSTNALNFSKQLYTGHMRTRYAVYTAQKNKTGIPSKRFALSN